MTIRENIKAILDCNFSIVGDEYIEIATNRIMNIIDNASGWIPVSERLPAYSGFYLISIDDLVTVADFTGAYFMTRGGLRIEVNAWQPLPEVYKEADK